MKVTDLPTLDVWVTDHCVSCARTLDVLSTCEALQGLVSVLVHRLDGAGESPPTTVVGGPAVVFQGAVIALGTPDCSALAGRIMAMMRTRPQVGGNR